MDKIKIGVTGTGSLIGQAIIKSIRASILNKHISLCGFDYFEGTVGSYWVESNFVLLDVLKKEVKEEDWIDQVIKNISCSGIKLLFIGLDFELPLFAKYKDLIEAHTQCMVIVSGSDVIRITSDKYLTYKFLKDNGFYYPKTWLLEECGDLTINFPCIVKPRQGSRSRDVFVVKGRQELNMALGKVGEPIIQELIGDPELEYTCGVIWFGGMVKRSIVLRRKLKDGNTETAYYTKNEPKIIYDYISAIANKLKPFGACNLQLRLDASSGVPKLFEINARHSGTTFIRALFGFKEVEYVIKFMLGLDCEDFILREGSVKRYSEEMFINNPGLKK